MNLLAPSQARKTPLADPLKAGLVKALKADLHHNSIVTGPFCLNLKVGLLELFPIKQV